MARSAAGKNAQPNEPNTKQQALPNPVLELAAVSNLDHHLYPGRGISLYQGALYRAFGGDEGFLQEEVVA
jgi:hypothetical protein